MATTEQEFRYFPDLAIEIRLMIWEAALPGPRLVSINRRMLKMPVERRQERTGAGEHDIGIGTGTGALTTNVETTSSRDLDFIFPCQKYGIESDSAPPTLLFVCHEANEVASKFYQRAFVTEAAFAGSYFDFHKDTLYIRYDNFINGDSNFEDLCEYFPSCFNTQQLEKVENLALLVDANANLYLQGILEEVVCEYFAYFKGVKVLTLVSSHYDSLRHDDESRILLIDLIDLKLTQITNGSYTLTPHRWCEEAHEPESLDTYDVEVQKHVMERIRSQRATDENNSWLIPEQIQYKVSVEVSKDISGVQIVH